MATAPTKRIDLNEIETAKYTWERFHEKAYKRIRHVNMEWPTKWYKMGHVTHVYYRSDKWMEDGDFVDYYHEHGPKIAMWFADEAVDADELLYCSKCGRLVYEVLKHDKGAKFKPCGHVVSQKMLQAMMEDQPTRHDVQRGRPPVKFPTVGAILGESLGFDLEEACYGEGPGDLLCTNAEGTFLFIVGADGSPYAIIEGPSLRVKAEGIVG